MNRALAEWCDYRIDLLLKQKVEVEKQIELLINAIQEIDLEVKMFESVKREEMFPPDL